MKLSVIVPSYKDPLLQKTVDSLLDNSELGKELEVIAVLDGYWPDPPLKEDPRVRVIHLENNKGMRGAINAGLAEAKGKYIMKCDSHCLFGPGYDRIMAENCAEDWLLIPRRFSLDEANWKRNEAEPIRDYHYITFPHKSSKYTVMSVRNWNTRTQKRKDPKFDIDDTMTFQGSCWFANRNYFLKRVGFLDDRKEAYGPFGGEQMEVGLKYWLGGGENKIIKKTWYAHLFRTERYYTQGTYERAYKRNHRVFRGYAWAAKHWINNEEPNIIYPFSWLVEKFWPVPSWPEDRSLWKI